MSFQLYRTILVCVTLLWATNIYAGGRPQFISLGTLGYAESLATDVSADGSVIVGMAYDASIRDFLMFRRTEAGTSFQPFHKHYVASRPRISDNGLVIAGAQKVGNSAQAVRWLANGAVEPLGRLPNSEQQWAFGISAEGGTIVGGDLVGSHITPVRWDDQGISSLDTSHGFGFAVAGPVIAGSAENKGILWPSGQQIGLPNSISTWPQAISADGTLVAGFSTFQPGRTTIYDEAFIWDAAHGSRRIGGGKMSIAWDVSPDGSVVVGGNFNGETPGAFFWTSETGHRNIQDWLTGMGVPGLEGWTLNQATGVSYDGQTIVGHGLHNSKTEAWMVKVPKWKKFLDGMPYSSSQALTVPEPASVVLFLFAFVALAYRFKRKQ